MIKIKLIFLSSFLFFSCTEKNKNIPEFESTDKTKELIISFNKFYSDYFEIEYLNLKEEEFDYWIEFEHNKNNLTRLRLSHVKKSSVNDVLNISGFSIIDSNKIYITGNINEMYFKKTNIVKPLKEEFNNNYKPKAEYYDPPYLILTFDNFGKLIATKPQPLLKSKK